MLATKIEGLADDYQETELLDDTSPYKIQAKFEVVSEEMPALSAAEGRLVRKNFVHLSCVWELGRTSFRRRITDSVTFDEEGNKWRVLKLAPEGQSDIKMWPDAWNAFARGASEDTLGTPLMMLFKNDPSRVEYYGASQIKTVERLSSLNPADLEKLGAGAGADQRRAQAYLARAQGLADKSAATYEITKVSDENKSLKAQVDDLTSKLTQLLQAQLGEEPKKKRGRPASENNL